MRTRQRGIPTTVRVALLARSQGRCERCGQLQDRLDPHHRQQRSCGGQDVLSNLVHVCRRCHDTIHDQNIYTFGWLVRSWDTPMDVPVHLWNGRALLGDGGEAVKVPA